MELSELQPQLSLPAHQNYPPRWCNPGSAPSLILGWFPICITNPTFQPDNLDTVGFPGGRVVKKLPASAGAATDTGLIPGLWRSPGDGNGNSLQYSCLENSTDTPLAGYSPWGCRVGHDWALVKNHDINKLLPLKVFCSHDSSGYSAWVRVTPSDPVASPLARLPSDPTSHQERRNNSPGRNFPLSRLRCSCSLDSTKDSVGKYVKMCWPPLFLQGFHSEEETQSQIPFSHQTKGPQGWGRGEGRNQKHGSQYHSIFWIKNFLSHWSLGTQKTKPFKQTLRKSISQKTPKKCTEWMLMV